MKKQDKDIFMNDINNTLIKINKEYNKIIKEFDILKKDFEDKKEEINKLMQDIDNKDKEIHDLKNENINKTETINNLNKNYNNKKEEIKNLKQNIDNKDKEIDDLKNENNNIKQEINNFTKGKDNKSINLTNGDENKELKRENINQEKELNNKNKENFKIINVNKNNEKNFEILNLQHNSLEKMLNTLNENLDKINPTFTTYLNNENNICEKCTNKIKAIINFLIKQNKTILNELKDYQNKLEKIDRLNQEKEYLFIQNDIQLNNNKKNEKIKKLLNEKEKLEKDNKEYSEAFNVLSESFVAKIEQFNSNYENNLSPIVSFLCKNELNSLKEQISKTKLKNENKMHSINKKNQNSQLLSNCKKQNKKITFINHISINISNYKDLISKGWKIENHFEDNFEIKEDKGLLIGFIGNFSEGKTYYLNKLFDCDLLLEPTKNINYYFYNKNIRIIDIPGSNKIEYINKKEDVNQEIKDKINEKIKETKIKDFINEKFVLDNVQITIMIINYFNLITKKKIGKIIRILNENYKETSDVKSLYIIHNNLKIKSDNDYNEYVKNNFPKDFYYNIDNLAFSEKINETKFEIIHFVPKHYQNKNDEIIQKIKEQIYSHLPINLLNVDKLISNTFKKFNKLIFNKTNDSNVKIKDNKISIESIGEDLIEDNDDINNNSFIENFAWSYYRQYIPYYCCFIDLDYNLNIQIELVGFKNCKISYKTLSDYYRFHIFAERKNDDEIKKSSIIQSNISEENLDFYFKIPINSFTFSNNKYDEYTFKDGLMTFKYKNQIFNSLYIP